MTRSICNAMFDRIWMWLADKVIPDSSLNLIFLPPDPLVGMLFGAAPCAFCQLPISKHGTEYETGNIWLVCPRDFT
jgi:hypothetical protein